MRVKFITAIYSNLNGTDFGGRTGRKDHYKFSLLSLLKMTEAQFLCYTSLAEIEELENFFYHQHGCDRHHITFKVFDLYQTKSKNIIDQKKDVEASKKSDRCFEIQYNKFHWWWEEDGTYDYYYWIDAGLSHTGIIPDKYLAKNIGYRNYFECNLFDNNFLKNLVEFTGDKFFIISKDNVRNYWDSTVDPKWYNNYSNELHIIGGLFGGNPSLWNYIVPEFEDKIEKIIPQSDRLPSEENILSLLYYNNLEIFNKKYFETWWHENNTNHKAGFDPDQAIAYLTKNKSFYKILEELNPINE
jgi:hypothetical protein